MLTTLKDVLDSRGYNKKSYFYFSNCFEKLDMKDQINYDSKFV
jgi:hypothetical protein